jgi:hypothetical protein
MSNNYGSAGSWREILQVKDDNVTHCHNVMFDPYEHIIWTVWGDNRPGDTILFSNDFGQTWQQPDGENYYRCTNIMPFPHTVWFGTDEKYFWGAYEYKRPKQGTFQSKFIPELAWAGKKDSEDDAPLTWATKPVVIFGKNALGFFGYIQGGNAMVPAQIYATDGNQVISVWCQDKIPDGSGEMGIVKIEGPDENGRIVADLRSVYGSATKAMVVLEVGDLING